LFGPALTVSPTEVVIGESQTQTSVSVETSSTDVAWTASTDADWLTVSPAKGTGKSLVVLKADPAKYTAKENNATVSIEGGGVKVSVSVVAKRYEGDPTKAYGGVSRNDLPSSAAFAPPLNVEQSVFDSPYWPVEENDTWMLRVGMSGGATTQLTVTEQREVNGISVWRTNLPVDVAGVPSIAKKGGVTGLFAPLRAMPFLYYAPIPGVEALLGPYSPMGSTALRTARMAEPVGGEKVLYNVYFSVTGSGTILPTPGNHSYQDGSVVTMTATPSSGWYFSHWALWYLDSSGSNAIYSSNATITINEDMEVAAVFEQLETPTEPTINIGGFPVAVNLYWANVNGELYFTIIEDHLNDLPNVEHWFPFSDVEKIPLYLSHVLLTEGKIEGLEEASTKIMADLEAQITPLQAQITAYVQQITAGNTVRVENMLSAFGQDFQTYSCGSPIMTHTVRLGADIATGVPDFIAMGRSLSKAYQQMTQAMNRITTSPSDAETRAFAGAMVSRFDDYMCDDPITQWTMRGLAAAGDFALKYEDAQDDQAALDALTAFQEAFTEYIQTQYEANPQDYLGLLNKAVAFVRDYSGLGNNAKAEAVRQSILSFATAVESLVSEGREYDFFDHGFGGWATLSDDLYDFSVGFTRENRENVIGRQAVIITRFTKEVMGAVMDVQSYIILMAHDMKNIYDSVVDPMPGDRTIANYVGVVSDMAKFFEGYGDGSKDPAAAGIGMGLHAGHKYGVLGIEVMDEAEMQPKDTAKGAFVDLLAPAGVISNGSDFTAADIESMFGFPASTQAMAKRVWIDNPRTDGSVALKRGWYPTVAYAKGYGLAYLFPVTGVFGEDAGTFRKVFEIRPTLLPKFMQEKK
jgi:hypothetical protein